MNEDVRHPSTQFLRRIDICELLPQQDPFIMIGQLTEFSEGVVVTETCVNNTLLFFENGELTSVGIMENIAQTCAARIGYVNKYILNCAIQLGFIGAVRNFVVRRTPQSGEIMMTRIKVLEEVLGMTLADVIVTCGSHVIATAQMKIALDRGDKK